MSQFHSRNIKGKKGLNLAEYNFDDYGIHILNATITPEVNTEFINLSNVDGCCISPTVYGCTKIEFTGEIVCPDDGCSLQLALDMLGCHLILPSDRECGEFFDIEFSDECDNRYFTYGKITRPLTCGESDNNECYRQEFSFEVSLEKPEYYKMKNSVDNACSEMCCEPQLYCYGSDRILEDDECCDRGSIETKLDFCRNEVDVFTCNDWFDKGCINKDNLCILTNNGNYRAVPRITSTEPIECVSILNHTNGTEVTLDGEFNNLVIEQDGASLIVMEGCVNKNNTRTGGNGIKLDKGENCLTVEGVSEGEICFQWYDTYQFTG